MSSARRYLLSRPRTKLYDYNYTMGERLYRPMVDALDKRGPRGSSTANVEATPSYSQPPPQTRRRSLDEGSEGDEGVSATIRRIRASRAAMEEETRAMEESSVSRRAATRARLDMSDRLMDSVGIKTISSEESIRRPRRAISEIEDDPFFKKRTFAFDDENEGSSVTRWSKLGSGRNAASNGDSYEESSFDTKAAASRAKQSRARIAEIDNEMEDLANRSKARSARRAQAQVALSEAAEDGYTASAVKSVRVKRTTITENRSIM